MADGNNEVDSEKIDFSFDEIEIPPIKYEYLDHTADVQIHAWGDNLKEVYEQCGMAMFGYMTELDYVDIKECYQLKVTGFDVENLMFKYLDELLFLFSVEPNLVCRLIRITEFDLNNFRITCKCYGEEFQIGKHPQCTEIKAITYSAMQIINDEQNKNFQCFVIIDI